MECKVIEIVDLFYYGFPNYMLTRDGNIFSKKSWRFIKKDKTGCVCIASSPQKYRRVSVRVLMGLCFWHPPIETKHQKRIPEAPDYFVHSDGRIWSCITARWLVPSLVKQYYYVKLNDKTYLVSRLVAKAFVPNPDNKPEVNHIDANKLNNNASNLEWTNRSENMKHAYNLGLIDMDKARRASFCH